MAELFLSHSTKDKQLALDVEAALEAVGHRVFVDSDHDDGIAPSKDWRAELFREIRLCDAVVFINSTNSQSSMWCFTELALGIERSKPIYSLNLTADVQPHALLGSVQAIRLESDLNASITWLQESLVRDFGGDQRWFNFDRSRDPYPGLRSFETADAAAFFGRDVETKKVVDRIVGAVSSPDGDLITLIGPSGMGKSSLVQAGVLPRFLGRDDWTVVGPFEPGNFPIDRLVASLKDVAPEINADVTTDSLREGGLASVMERMRAGKNPQHRVLVVVDQFESLAVADAADRDDFVKALDLALAGGSRVTLLLVARQDRLDELQRFHPLGSRISQPLIIAPMDRDGLALAIEKPAVLVDMKVGAGFTNKVIREAATSESEPGAALPLIAATLAQAYQEAKKSGAPEITVAHYDAVGGVSGAIARNAEQADAKLGSGADVDRLLLRFVEVTERRAAVARPINLAELNEVERALVGKLDELQLVTSDGISARLIHDRLIDSWHRLHDIVDRERDQLVFWSKMKRDSETWNISARRAEDLAGRDDTAKAVAEMREPGFSPSSSVVKDYVSASAAMYWRIRLRNIAVMSLVVLLAATASGFFAAAQTRATQLARKRKIERSQRLADLAVGQVSSNGRVSMLLATEAITTRQMPATIDALSQVVARQPIREFGPDSAANAVDYDQGSNIVSAGIDGVARVWNASSPKEVRTLRPIDGREAALTSVVYSPDGSLVVTGAQDGTVTIFRPSTREKPLSIRAAESAVSEVSFDRSGTRFAAGTDDGTAVVVIASTGERMTIKHPDKVRSLVFSPLDNDMLVTVCHDGVVRLWDLRKPSTPTKTFQGYRRGSPRSDRPLLAVDFSADGRSIVTGSRDGLVRVWDIATGQVDMVFGGHDGEVTRVAFSPDGKLVASAGSDQTLRLWSAKTGRQIRVWGSNGLRPVGVAFAPDGSAVATASPTGVTIWPASDSMQTFRGNGKSVVGLAASPDGALLATAGTDGNIRFWDLSTGRESKPSIQEADVQALGLSVQFLATLAADGRVGVFDVGERRNLAYVDGADGTAVGIAVSKNLVAVPGEEGNMLLIDGSLVTRNPAKATTDLPSTGDEAFVDVSFSGDGSQIVGARSDGTVWTWDTASRKLVSTRSRPTNNSNQERGAVSAVASYSGDQQWSALADEGAVPAVIWRGADLQRTVGQNFVSIAFGPGARTLIAGTKDGSIEIWDTRTGQRLRRFENAHVGESKASTGVRRVVIVPPGSRPGQEDVVTRFASVGADGLTRVWTCEVCDVDALRRTARTTIDDQGWKLSADEKENYGI